MVELGISNFFGLTGKEVDMFKWLKSLFKA